MADLQSVLFTTLNSVCENKTYPLEVPMGVSVPFIRYARTGGNNEYSLLGSNRTVRGVFQIDCYHSNYADALALAVAVKAAMNSQIDSFLLNEFHTKEDENVSIGLRYFRVILVFSVWVVEA